MVRRFLSLPLYMVTTRNRVFFFEKKMNAIKVMFQKLYLRDVDGLYGSTFFCVWSSSILSSDSQWPHGTWKLEDRLSLQTVAGFVEPLFKMAYLHELKLINSVCVLPSTVEYSPNHPRGHFVFRKEGTESSFYVSTYLLGELLDLCSTCFHNNNKPSLALLFLSLVWVLSEIWIDVNPAVHHLYLNNNGICPY